MAPRATSVALALVFLGALGVASAGCDFYATVGETYTTTSSNSYCFNATDMPKGYNGFALKVVEVLTPPPAPNAICAGWTNDGSGDSNAVVAQCGMEDGDDLLFIGRCKYRPVSENYFLLLSDKLQNDPSFSLAWKIEWVFANVC